MHTTITKTFTAETAHWLRNHGGQCRNLHGHSYIYRISITGKVLQEENALGIPGMVMDFANLKTVFNTTVGLFDHATLAPWTLQEYMTIFLPRNPDLIELWDSKIYCCGQDPTAEFLAKLTAHSIVESLTRNYGRATDHLRGIAVEVFETATSSASYLMNFEGQLSSNGLLHEIWRNN